MAKHTPREDRRRRNQVDVADPRKPGDGNKRCPCGSGKKFKRCCKGKPARPQPALQQRTPTPQEIEEHMAHRSKAAQIISSMSKTSLTPAEIYAFSQTQKVINHINRDVVDPEVVALWDKSLVEFEELRKQGPNKE